MTKKLFFLLSLLLSLTAVSAVAQTGPCDPPVVNQLVSDLIDEGFDCLNGAGPFDCVDDVFEYAFENCPPPIDTTFGDPCDPVVVNQLVDDLIVEGFGCLNGAGPFDCVDDVFDYVFANCPPTGGDPCDSALVAQLTQDLIAQGAGCLVGAGPFACVDDVFEYVFENCPPPIDTTGNYPCDSALVDPLVQDLIAQGADCLIGAGPFACVEEVFDYLFENCPPPGGDDCDPVAVAAAIDDLVAQGYDCLTGAGPFDCVHEVLCYALENCPMPMDTGWYDVPDCLLDLPLTITTFQQFLEYIAENCDSSVTADIPTCWLSAPSFDTDEEFFEWIMENCPNGDSLITQTDNALLRSYFAGNTTSVKNSDPLSGVTLSPNPTVGNLEIRLAEGQISRVEMFDLTGRKLLSQENVENNRLLLDLNQQPQGMYLLRIFDQQNRMITHQVVKQ